MNGESLLGLKSLRPCVLSQEWNENLMMKKENGFPKDNEGQSFSKSLLVEG